MVMVNCVHAPAARSILMSNLHNEYIARLERQCESPKTVAYYENAAAKFLTVIGSMKVDDVTPPDIQEAVDKLTADGYAAVTVHGYYWAIRAGLNHAVKLGLIAYCPCRTIDLPAEELHKAEYILRKSSCPCSPHFGNS